MVELANPRAVMEADRCETAEEMAAMQKQIAKEEVDEAFWIYENNCRAADYRLRGPGLRTSGVSALGPRASE